MSAPLLRPAEVAIRLAISRAQVYRLAAEGDLPCVHLGPRTVRFHQQAVEEFIKQHTVTSADTEIHVVRGFAMPDADEQSGGGSP